jgi:peptide deformylase
LKLPCPVEKLKIVYYPDPVLLRRCAPVEAFDETLAAIAGRMIELMRAYRGVGLAAPQVGVMSRLFVTNHTGEPGDDRVWVNPQLKDLVGAEEAEEGCLSIPGVNVIKRRSVSATIEAFDVGGASVTAQAEGLLARVWQHEHDHLDGRLIIHDMAESAKIANKQAIRRLEAEYQDSRKR